MSTTITLDEAQSQLRDLISHLAPGDEIVVMDNEKPVARIMSPEPRQRKMGTLQGTVLHMAPDFNDTYEIPEDDVL